jgi:hypothetical protein
MVQPVSTILQYLQKAVQILGDSTRRSANDFDATSRLKRIICIIQPQPDSVPPFHTVNVNPDTREGEIVNIVEELNTMIQAFNQKLVHSAIIDGTSASVVPIPGCELVVIHTTVDGSLDTSQYGSVKVGLVSAEYHVIPSLFLLSAMQDLASVHLRLRSIRITGIPMKTGLKIFQCEVFFCDFVVTLCFRVE